MILFCVVTIPIFTVEPNTAAEFGFFEWAGVGIASVCLGIRSPKFSTFYLYLLLYDSNKIISIYHSHSPIAPPQSSYLNAYVFANLTVYHKIIRNGTYFNKIVDITLEYTMELLHSQPRNLLQLRIIRITALLDILNHSSIFSITYYLISIFYYPYTPFSVFFSLIIYNNHIHYPDFPSLFRFFNSIITCK